MFDEWCFLWFCFTQLLPCLSNHLEACCNSGAEMCQFDVYYGKLLTYWRGGFCIGGQRWYIKVTGVYIKGECNCGQSHGKRHRNIKKNATRRLFILTNRHLFQHSPFGYRLWLRFSKTTFSSSLLNLYRGWLRFWFGTDDTRRMHGNRVFLVLPFKVKSICITLQNTLKTGACTNHTQ